MRQRSLVVAVAAAGLAGASALAWTALRDPRGGTPAAGPARAPAAMRPRTAAEREAADVVDAVERGRLSAALAGVCAFLDHHAPGDIAGDSALASSFGEARIASGRWGLGEAETLASTGEEGAAGAILARSARALRGTPAEGEIAAVEARVRDALARRGAAGREAVRQKEVIEPLRVLLAAAVPGNAEPAKQEKSLAELRRALQVAKDPEARKLLEAAIGELRTSLASEKSRAARRRAADDAVAKGEYARAREILEGLVVPGDGAAADPQAAKDRERIDGLKDLEENREPEALAAVRRALRWMTKQQLADGSFSMPLVDDQGGKPTEDERKKAKYRTGVTGLAALALLGHVRYDITDEFAAPLSKSLAWIAAKQKKDGSFDGSLYENSICALALVEADRLLHRTEMRPAAASAVAWVQAAQNIDGGWRYAPRTPTSDVSVTGWALQSLLHAGMGSYEVSQPGMDLAFSYLDRMTDSATSRTGYTDAGKGSPTMTAVALFCRLRRGVGISDPVVKSSADFVSTFAPGGKAKGLGCYYLFYASDAMSRLGGDYWKAWAPALKKTLLAAQVDKGDAEGAWPTVGDPMAEKGDVKPVGAVFLAAMNALSLENFFEHRE